MELDPANPYKIRLPKPNYLPHNVDYDQPVVKKFLKPLDRPSDMENAAYLNKIKRFAHDHGITKPKGYNVSFHYNPDMENTTLA